jgi:hypothetical protein
MLTQAHVDHPATYGGTRAVGRPCQSGGRPGGRPPPSPAIAGRRFFLFVCCGSLGAVPGGERCIASFWCIFGGVTAAIISVVFITVVSTVILSVVISVVVSRAAIAICSVV